MQHIDEFKTKPKSLPRPEETDRSKKTPTKKITNHFFNGKQHGILLMMCQVMIRGPNGSLTQARALQDSGSEASFITKRIAQQLRFYLVAVAPWWLA